MRVLHLVQQPQRRGAEMFAYDLTSRLLRTGHDVSTTYLYPASAAGQLPLRGNDTVAGSNPRHVAERIGVNPTLVRRLGRIVDEFEPDIVQANGARTLKYGAVLHRFRSFGLVYRSIGDPTVWVTGQAKRAFYRRIVLPRVDGIAAVSGNTLEGLASLYDLDGKVVAQIPRGIDPQRLAPRMGRQEVRDLLQADAGDPVVVFVGSLTDEKRPDRLARVFADVARAVPDARLWVVGDGPGRGALESEFVSAGLTDRIRYVGATDDVGSYIAAADVLLLTSDTEGLPGVVLEAAALGVPAVATDVGGVRDAITQGVSGLLADAVDEQELAASLARLLTNPAERAQLGEAAEQQFRTTFDIAHVADRYVDLYGEVLEAAARES